MAVDLDTILRFVHITSATLWVGGGAFNIFMIGPNVMAAGDAGKAFMMSAQRRGGFGKYIGPLAIIAVLSGLWQYYRLDMHSDAFATANMPFTIGMILGVIALVIGLGGVLPAEKKLKAVAEAMKPGEPPSEEQAGIIMEQVGRAKKAGGTATILALVVLFFMAGRAFFA